MENIDVWNRYTRAWTNVTAEERKALLKMAVNDECIFSNMAVIGKGTEALLQLMEQFQDQFPGGSFQTTEFTEQHKQSLASWTLLDRDGVAVLSGANYTRFDEDGLMSHIAGFWKSPGVTQST